MIFNICGRRQTHVTNSPSGYLLKNAYEEESGIKWGRYESTMKMVFEYLRFKKL